MKSITLWVLNITSITLTFFSISTSAYMNTPVTLKLSFDQYATPHATFVIDGQPVYAMLDTGSSFGFHLHESQLKKIKGLKKERVYRSTDAAGKIQQNIEYLADTLDMNGIKLKNITITPLKKWGMVISGKGNLPDNPVVGIGAFKDKQILLDYISHSLTIAENIHDASLTTGGFKEIPFQMSADGIIFNVEQSGFKYNLILDTGATTSMVWSERLKQHDVVSCLLVNPEMDNKGCEATMLTIKSGNGTSEPFAAVIVAGDFKHMGSIDGLIGNSFLAGRKIVIDFKNSKVLISDARQKG
ncbi:hypothetical protein [Erwinia piriflorinigrans]